MSYDCPGKMSMQQAREGHFNPASPHSSSGVADSLKGTPDTRLTTFSPEDGSARSAKPLGSINAGAREAGPIKYEMNASQAMERPGGFFHNTLGLDKDPFVTGNSNFKSAQKLSPTASEFSPLPTTSTIRGPTSELTGADLLLEGPSQGYSQSSGQASGQSSAPFGGTYIPYVHEKMSTETGVSRFLILSSGMGGRVIGIEVELYLSELAQTGIPFQGTRYIFESNDQVFVRFTNIRSACTVFSNISLGARPWNVRAITAREFFATVEPNTRHITDHEGQIYVSLFPHSYVGRPRSAHDLEDLLKGILKAEGDLFAFKPRGGGAETSVVSALAEYCDNDVAVRAVSKLNNIIVEGFQICTTPYRPDVLPMVPGTFGGVGGSIRPVATPTDLATSLRRLSIGRPPSVMPSATSVTGSLMGAMPPSSVSGGLPLGSPYGMMPMVYPSLPLSSQYMYDPPSSRTPSSLLQSSNYSLTSPAMSQQSSLMSTDLITPRQFQHYGRPDNRRQNAMRISRSPYYNAANHHNHVDVGRIRDGIDVRTTIMLRNIPNKVDQALLKRIVDESSWGKYDFMYLRIDFINDCNVGYAFINFVDPLDIVDFVHARANQRWNCFKSDKVAEISYATIQGKDCLVQKFRNSSVMLELPHYRPKLFFTMNGPCPELAGQEEPFPEPDNQSKMKRSCENAEHVGLFTPNAGQHFRDEQRRRRSQFDRGNPRLEEPDYNAPLSNQSYYPLK